MANPVEHAATTGKHEIRRAEAMRVIYLTLAFFVIAGIGANCGVSGLEQPGGCGPNEPGTCMSSDDVGNGG
jgi:hypothetical protein